MKKSYYYANAQILAQREHTDPEDPNVYDESFYVHDRLGSVRMVVAYDDTNEIVETVNSYTYTPFGQDYGTLDETVDNPFQFTGQWHDSEIDQYYLRARQYDPAMMRFTSRDPVTGDRQEPLTLHKYLYTANSPVNRIDSTGKSWQIFGALTAGTAVRAAATYITAIGIDYDNDALFEMGLNMHHLIAPAMAIGAMAGPFLPGAAQTGANALWQVSLDATYCAVGSAQLAARATAYWIATHPWETINMMDALYQFTGDPGGLAPFTPLGFAAWLITNSESNDVMVRN